MAVFSVWNQVPETFFLFELLLKPNQNINFQQGKLCVRAERHIVCPEEGAVFGHTVVEDSVWNRIFTLFLNPLTFNIDFCPECISTYKSR